MSSMNDREERDEGDIHGTTLPSTSENQKVEEELDPESFLSFAYEVERAMYAIAIVLGFIASVYTIRKFRRCCKKNLDVAARLLSYKISLSVADALILFVYAPTQLVWISTFWWYGGGILCRLYKFTTTFAFHLTGNMQVLIAFDRLITMTRINKLRVKGTTYYNTRLFLSLSWIIAFASSFPQLLIFKIVYSSEGNPQCSSIWNEYTHLANKELERMIEIGEFDAENETMKASFYNSTIQQEWIRMQEWEKMYNIVHVMMMCVIPYLLELIFYALILSLLSDAEKGEFSGFRRFIHKKIVQLCRMKRGRERKDRFNSLPIVVEDPATDSPVHSPPKVTLTRRPSRSVNSSPTRNQDNRQDVLRVSYRNRFQSVDVGIRRMTMATDTQRLSPLHSIDHEGERSHLLGVRHQSRRASAPCGDNKVNAPRVSVPWMQTVIVARRNARKKAFLMLSFNLLLWLPYSAHAIVSSFIELNYINFQFACALVVFNAITNILL